MSAGLVLRRGLSFALLVLFGIFVSSGAMAAGGVTQAQVEQGVVAEVATEVSWGSANGCVQNIKTNNFGTLTPSAVSPTLGVFDASPHALASIDPNGKSVWVGCVTANTGLASVGASGLHDLGSANATLPLADVNIGLTNASSGQLNGGSAQCAITAGQGTADSCSLPTDGTERTLLSEANPGTTELNWQYQLNLPADQPTGTYSGGEVVFTATAGTAQMTDADPENLASPSVSAGTPREGRAISTTNGSWDNHPTSYSYQWERCDTSGANCQAIDGASANSYTPTDSDVGHTLVIQVTATNQNGSTSSKSSATGVVISASQSAPLPSGCVINATPAACVASAHAAGLSDDEILINEYGGSFYWGTSGVRAYSVGTDDESNIYENELEVEEGHIFRVSRNEDESITVYIGVDDGAIERIAAPSSEANICDYTNKACYGDGTHYYGNPGPPANNAAPVISGVAESGSTLSATTGKWVGTPAPTYAYQWERCNESAEDCSPITGATSATYAVSDADIGSVIAIRITATNSVGSASAVSTTAVVVPPVATPLPPGCAINATPAGCIASAQNSGFADSAISVDEYGDFFWGRFGGAYSTGVDDSSDVYENSLEVEEDHIFRVNVSPSGTIAIFVGVHNQTLEEITAPSDQANVCDYTNKACYGDATHYYGNP